jgi:hypothetical protein
MVRGLVVAMLACVSMNSLAQAQEDADWKIESTTRCRLSAAVGAGADRYTLVFQTDFNAPGVMKVAVLGGADDARLVLESPAGRWPVKHDAPNAGEAANRFKAGVVSGADWTLRRTAKKQTIGFLRHAGNISRAAAGFDACVAAIPKRHAIAPDELIRPRTLSASLGPDVCELDARYEHGDDRVDVKLVDVPDSPQMIVTGLVRTVEDRVGLVDLSGVGGQNVALDDLAARNDVADAILLRTRLLAGDILKVPVRFTTGDTWTLALGGPDVLTTIAVFDACVRSRSAPQP